MLNYRDDTKNKTDAYKRSMYLYIQDLATGREVARFGEGHSFANAFVNGPELNVFASEGTDRDWFQSLYRFSTTDLKTWKRELAIPQAPGEHLFNASVCRDDQGYLMAYESDKPVQFCFKFARSTDLASWKKLDGLVFTGAGRRIQRLPGASLRCSVLLCDLPACCRRRAQGLDFLPGPLQGPRGMGTESIQSHPGFDPASIDFKELQERMLFVEAIDSVRCFEEGVLRSVPDANIGSIFGIGFPPWTGGVLQYINGYGLPEFVARARELAAKYGDRFEPPASLVERAESGEQYV